MPTTLMVPIGTVPLVIVPDVVSLRVLGDDHTTGEREQREHCDDELVCHVHLLVAHSLVFYR